MSFDGLVHDSPEAKPQELDHSWHGTSVPVGSMLGFAGTFQPMMATIIAVYASSGPRTNLRWRWHAHATICSSLAQRRNESVAAESTEAGGGTTNDFRLFIYTLTRGRQIVAVGFKCRTTSIHSDIN